MTLDSRLFEYDPFTRIERIFHYDEDDGSITIENRQHGEGHLELTRGIFNNFDERANWKGDGFHHVASLPPVIMSDLQRKGILDDPAAFKKWLNDRDNRCFRTRPGRV